MLAGNFGILTDCISPARPSRSFGDLGSGDRALDLRDPHRVSPSESGTFGLSLKGIVYMLLN